MRILARLTAGRSAASRCASQWAGRPRRCGCTRLSMSNCLRLAHLGGRSQPASCDVRVMQAGLRLISCVTRIHALCGHKAPRGGLQLALQHWSPAALAQPPPDRRAGMHSRCTAYPRHSFDPLPGCSPARASSTSATFILPVWGPGCAAQGNTTPNWSFKSNVKAIGTVAVQMLLGPCRLVPACGWISV